MTTKTVTTWMCDNGHHGTSERRWVDVAGFENQYEGYCAGTVYDWHTREQRECSCECHNN